MPKQYEHYFRAVPESEARRCEQDEGVSVVPCPDNGVFIDQWVDRWEDKNVYLDYCDEADFYKIRLSDALRDPKEFPYSDRTMIRRIQRHFNELCDSCRESVEKNDIWVYTFVVTLPKRKKGYRRREHSLYEYALGCSRGRRKAERIKEAKERKLNFYISEFGSAHPVWPKKDQWWKLKDNPKDEHLKDNEYIQYVRVLSETGLHDLTLSLGYDYKGNFLSVEIMEKDKYWLMRNYTLLDEKPFDLAVF